MIQNFTMENFLYCSVRFFLKWIFKWIRGYSEWGAVLSDAEKYISEVDKWAGLYLYLYAKSQKVLLRAFPQQVFILSSYSPYFPYSFLGALMLPHTYCLQNSLSLRNCCQLLTYEALFRYLQELGILDFSMASEQ